MKMYFKNDYLVVCINDVLFLRLILHINYSLLSNFSPTKLYVQRTWTATITFTHIQNQIQIQMKINTNACTNLFDLCHEESFAGTQLKVKQKSETAFFDCC